MELAIRLNGDLVAMRSKISGVVEIWRIEDREDERDPMEIFIDSGRALIIWAFESPLLHSAAISSTWMERHNKHHVASIRTLISDYSTTVRTRPTVVLSYSRTLLRHSCTKKVHREQAVRPQKRFPSRSAPGVVRKDIEKLHLKDSKMFGFAQFFFDSFER